MLPDASLAGVFLLASLAVTATASGGRIGPTEGRDHWLACCVAGCLWWICTTAQPAPNERANDRGEMGLYHRDLVQGGALFPDLPAPVRRSGAGSVTLQVLALAAGRIGEGLSRHPILQKLQTWLAASVLAAVALKIALPGQR
jgi:hypothetical protein